MDAILRIITNSTLLVTKFLRMGLADKNDHPPFFERNFYEVEVDEDEAINQTILSLNATDLDEVSYLNYEIVEGNEEGTFSVGNLTGEIYLAQPLDYETRNKYKLLLLVSDGRHEGGATVQVNVRDVNDNPPTFDSRLYEAEITEEDDRDLPRRIVTVKVTDGDVDRPPDVVFSLSGQGIDVGDPKNSYFEINPSSGDIYVRKPVDRDYPNGRPNWCLTVFAQDEGGTGLVGYSEVVVKLKDINDKAPLFPEVLYFGNVTENSTSGLQIITMKADDYDDPSEGTNAQVTYSIENGVIDEVTGKPIFIVEPSTGIVRTAVCCLDREKTQDYVIQIVATDGGGLKGTGTVSVSVLDVNDKPPQFTKREWVTEVDETGGHHLPSEPILTVSVQDEDLKNNFIYNVVESSGFGAEKFAMISNKNGTGSLVIIQPLDFEDPKQRDGFRFQIQVNDMGEEKVTDAYHSARTWVKVKLKDINDNEPQFLETPPEVQVFENTPLGTSLAVITASDPDMGGKSQVSYSIDRTSDKHRHFYIDNTGTVKLQQTLDREKSQVHQIKILVTDDGTPAKTATTTLTIKVKDVNDNAPRFLEDYRPVVPENQPPRKVAVLRASDDDDPKVKNGPPFHFRLDPHAPKHVKNSFKVDNVHRGPAAEGMAAVFSLREFDREEQKEYLLPIIIKDSGVPAMVGTSTLTVIIGDENDNVMQPGVKNILFYSYMGRTHGTQVGRVYVQDLDDWDLHDKLFTWVNSPHTNFKLDEDTGMITMKYILSETSYFLEFYVRDRKHSQSKIKASVKLTVRHIPEKAVRNAGSLRIGNITDKEFISQWDDRYNKSVQSKSDQFRKKIAKLFALKTFNVDVFSVQLKQERPPVTDVFFSVYDSQYYQPIEVNGVVMRHKKEIEEEVGIQILMVGINECLYENVHCDGSCTNRVKILKSQYLVDANRTSFVGVHTRVVPDCVCGARDFYAENSCRPNPCLNGGQCIEDIYNIYCKCPSGYDGPRCQILTRTFLGNGFAWFPPLEVCDRSHLSVEFLSKEPDGLIFYNGPIASSSNSDLEVTDFIALELEKGHLRFLLDYGSGTLQLKLDNTANFSDGNWHRADIFWNKENVRLDVDHCEGAPKYKREADGEELVDLSECQVFGTVPPFSEQLNVNSPLQVGGLAHPPLPSGSYSWHYLPHGHHFKGCIRNLMVNSHFYDFANPALQSNTEVGCPYFNNMCSTNSTKAGCGPNGICSGSLTRPVCLCNPGWTGTDCDEPTVPAYFKNQSYVKYSLSFVPSSFHTDIHLRFRTWEETGELLRISDQNTKTYGILEIKNRHIYFRYNLNTPVPEEKYLWLSSIVVSDGMWHLVKVQRYGATITLTLDGGEGRKYNETSGASDYMLMSTDAQEGVFIGGSVYHSSADVFSVQNDYKYGCLDDVRLNGNLLPLPPTLSSTQWADATAFHNLASQCVSSDQCLNVSCIAPFTCKDLWMKHECRCPEGSLLSKDLHSCLDEDECLSGPCENGGICNNLQPSYVCHCPHGFSGANCEVVEKVSKFQPSLPALAAIIACLLILVILGIVFICLRRKQRHHFSKDTNAIQGVQEINVKYEDDEGGGGRGGGVTILDLTALNVPATSTLSNGGSMIPKDKNVNVNLAMANVDVIVTSCQERDRKHAVHRENSSYDDLRNYAYEGGGSGEGSSSAVNSLSSLGSGTDSSVQNFEDLKDWGKPFAILYNMYVVEASDDKQRNPS
ncbi:neural-cadherin-like isoform X1 [Macrobrachium nipponense]|uniref:neural-cadherin-like isoform X1 n=2 Tax=Macrobrachium nipponense TaxID=159736 RepID=UPI0030C7F84D